MSFENSSKKLFTNPKKRDIMKSARRTGKEKGEEMEYRLVEKYEPPRKMRTKAGVVALDGSYRLKPGARVYLIGMTAIPGTWENGLLIRDEKGTEFHVMTGSLKAGW